MFSLYFMNKITSYSADYQTFPTLFELEPVAGKKVTMCAGRSASDEIDLASQPTMTRLENRLSRKELFDIGEAFIDDFIASYNSEPDSIIILINRVMVRV